MHGWGDELHRHAMHGKLVVGRPFSVMLLTYTADDGRRNVMEKSLGANIAVGGILFVNGRLLGWRMESRFRSRR